MAWKVIRKEGRDRVTRHYLGDLSCFDGKELTITYTDGIEKIVATDPDIRSIEHIADPEDGYWFRNTIECGAFS